MIRKATLSDVLSIARLEKLTFPEPLSESFIYDEITLNPFAYYVVYEENHEVIGYMGLRSVDEHAEVMNFAVLESHRHMGVGTAILDHVLTYLKQHHVSLLTLEVRKSNKGAQALYEKFGFKKSHIRKDYYITEDAVVYVKEVRK
jgi:[ribosomal protein S18]-alanine N-acetyltransferase